MAGACLAPEAVVDDRNRLGYLDRQDAGGLMLPCMAGVF
jgi:hypothetical protein